MQVSLRALEPEDLELLYDWENRKTLWQVSNTIAPFSKFVLSKYIESAHLDIFQTRQLRLMIDLLGVSNKVVKTIGAIDLFDYEPMHNRAGVGIVIGDDSEKGKGFAGMALEALINYAFEVLQLKQLYCNIGVENVVSMQLFKKYGFQEIGIKKSWNKTANGYTDELLLQCIKP